MKKFWRRNLIIKLALILVTTTSCISFSKDKSDYTKTTIKIESVDIIYKQEGLLAEDVTLWVLMAKGEDEPYCFYGEEGEYLSVGKTYNISFNKNNLGQKVIREFNTINRIKEVE